MEKFSQWRDKGTGIAPFLPHPSSTFANTALVSSPVPVRLGNVVLAVISSILKIPLALALGILHFGIILPIIPSYPVRRVSARLLLTILGVWYWNVSIDGARRSVSRKNALSSPKAGDIIISNFLSPLDALVYSAVLDPIFVIPTYTGEIMVYTLLGAILAALDLPVAASSSTPPPLADIQAKALASQKVIVFFNEATPTNGRALLPPAIDQVPDEANYIGSKCRIFPSLIKYSPPDITTPIPPRSAVHYLCRVVCRWKAWGVRVRIAEPLDVSGKNAIISAFDEICRIGRIKRVGQDLSAGSKLDFVKAWKKGRS
ncbi:uncharacterized protein V1513DRAFT_454139 [Lipomyces chichibuensis]|uniref:uncharacterized protein n=1 Tax=Lipomyces chichibuensis TaxID=1546026 RepID=UPI00334365CC